MKRILVMAACLTLMASMAQAATLTVDGKGVGGAYTKVSAAIKAATSGDTISITTDSTILDILRIDKVVNITAPAGINPVIQHDGTTVSSTVTFLPGSGGADMASGAKLGSISGGRITVQYNRDMTAIPIISYLGVSNNTLPNAVVKFEQTTNTMATLENVLITEVGATNIASIHGIQHEVMMANICNLRYVDIDLARPGSITSASYGLVIGTTAQLINVYGQQLPSPVIYTSGNGPTYNLEHVRIKNYTRTAVWNNFKNGRCNFNYLENGPLGDRVGTSSKPWGGMINNQPAATFYCYGRNSVLRSSAGDSTTGGFAAQFGANDSSITLSRCVLINKITLNSTSSFGAITLGGTSATDARLRLAADHCDIVELGNVANNFAAISAPVDKTTSLTLVLTNNNIYSRSNKTFRIGASGLQTSDTLVSSHNNVFGPGTSIGYTAGTGDVSYDPLYFDADNSDMRYSNNTLKSADSEGKPVGTNGGYGNLWDDGIIAGSDYVINRASGWTTMK